MNRTVFSVAGGLCGLLVPLFWLLARAYLSRKAWWDRWLEAELSKNTHVYVLVGLVFVAFFAFIGYWIGRRYDEFEEESQSSQDSNIELSTLAATDGLTSLFNVRSMHDRLIIELENAMRAPLSILLIDIDHFKKINDKYGHPFGDEVLIQVAKILKQSVRRVDAVGRLGGEEFLIILSQIDLEAAKIIAERIREAVAEEKFKIDKKRVTVTVSIGVAEHQTLEISDRKSLLKAADAALYKAKEEGRNRIKIAQKI